MPGVDRLVQSRFDSITVEVRTPDGKLYVMIMEDSRGVPIGIQLQIGKAGSSVLAWSDALARLCSCLLDKGFTINDLIVELSNITTDRSVRNNGGVRVRSGVDGVVYALMQYKRDKRERLTRVLGF